MLLFSSFIVSIIAQVVSAPVAQAAVLGDDYPANLRNAAQDSLVDPWNFYNRECTSFVAWRLNHANGVGFHNYYLGPHWGNANNWGAAARTAGLTVDASPAIGAVAWFNSGVGGAGSFGHVAWVAAVSGGTVTLEEYNWGSAGTYHTRSVSAGAVSGYIHVKDLPQGNPFGSLDSVTSPGAGLVRVGGWAADPDLKSGPLTVHVYANDKMVGAATANGSRPDVPRVFPGYGANLGFDATFAAQSAGSVRVCVYVINVGTGDSNTQLGCVTVNVANPNPFGSLDEVAATAPGTVKVRGWAADPNDKNGPLVVHIYGGSPFAGKLTANKSRPDVAAAYPGYGSNLGFSGTVYPTVSGTVKVCAYGINVGTGWDNTQLGCKTITIADPNPFGRLDSAKAKGARKVAVRGWAADPNDKNGPVKVRLYANGKYIRSALANKKRPDVKSAYPGYGGHLGYSFTAKLPSRGAANVCIVALDKGAGWVNPQIGCITVTVR